MDIGKTKILFLKSISIYGVDSDQLASDGSAQFSNGHQCKKTCRGGGGGGGGCKQQRGADQPVHHRILTSAFVIHILESIISRLATSEISIF